MANDPAGTIHAGTAVNEHWLGQADELPPDTFVLLAGERLGLSVERRNMRYLKAFAAIKVEKAAWKILLIKWELVFVEKANDRDNPEVPYAGGPVPNLVRGNSHFGTRRVAGPRTCGQDSFDYPTCHCNMSLTSDRNSSETPRT